MEYLPVCLRLQDAPVLLVGGGRIATRKARLLLRAGARLSVVSPAIDDELAALLEAHGGQWQQDAYHPDCLDGQHIVVAATPLYEVNAAVAAAARERHLPVNVVDTPELCSFIFPAIIDRSPLLVGVSSSGSSPVLARLVRRHIEAMLPAAYGRLAQFCGRWRDTVKAALGDENARRSFWESAIEGPIGEAVLAGREAEAATQLQDQLDAADTQRDVQSAAQNSLQNTLQNRGEVYLIGAGPGDPDLLTFKAARLLQRADVVLYDRLVAPAIVDMARRDAERIYVGKARSDHAVPQPEINQLLLTLAEQGKRVARLKGGDPFIFGRGGEEIALLAERGIAFQVVPGITAASGAACYAGIPLTHRDYAQSVRFVTAHLKNNSVEADWDQFTRSSETLVFYMGLLGLPTICAQLMAVGRSPETPIALVEQGTLPSQRVIVGTLETMPAIVEREQPRAPTLIIVGDVVRLHPQLGWFG